MSPRFNFSGQIRRPYIRDKLYAKPFEEDSVHLLLLRNKSSCCKLFRFPPHLFSFCWGIPHHDRQKARFSEDILTLSAKYPLFNVVPILPLRIKLATYCWMNTWTRHSTLDKNHPEKENLHWVDCMKPDAGGVLELIAYNVTAVSVHFDFSSIWEEKKRIGPEFAVPPFRTH